MPLTCFVSPDKRLDHTEAIVSQFHSLFAASSIHLSEPRHPKAFPVLRASSFSSTLPLAASLLLAAASSLLLGPCCDAPGCVTLVESFSNERPLWRRSSLDSRRFFWTEALRCGAAFVELSRNLPMTVGLSGGTWAARAHVTHLAPAHSGDVGKFMSTKGMRRESATQNRRIAIQGSGHGN